jgi:hypothetical protein
MYWQAKKLMCKQIQVIAQVGDIQTILPKAGSKSKKRNIDDREIRTHASFLSRRLLHNLMLSYTLTYRLRPLGQIARSTVVEVLLLIGIFIMFWNALLGREEGGGVEQNLSSKIFETHIVFKRTQEARGRGLDQLLSTV